jgi:hypothetical protein
VRLVLVEGESEVGIGRVRLVLVEGESEVGIGRVRLVLVVGESEVGIGRVGGKDSYPKMNKVQTVHELLSLFSRLLRRHLSR